MARPRFALLTLLILAVSSRAAARDPGGGFPREEARTQIPRSTLGMTRGPQHLLLQAEHSLLPHERGALERIGCRIVRELGDRHYIVRASRESRERAAEETYVAGVSTIPRAWRIHSSALREVARLGPVARLNVLFHDDISFEEAVSVIASAGGWLRSPLQTDFKLPRRLEILFPDDDFDALAASDAILQIHGPMPPIKAMNADAANLSQVTPLHTAPYDLSGAGVVVSVWDYGDTGPALADASHVEFEGRVVKNGASPVHVHPTHVTGTIAAKGINATAKGMAPAVTVQNFGVEDEFLNDKEANFARLGIRADNNSWGFVHGWNFASRGWEWYGEESGDSDLNFGAYGFTSSGLDQLTREQQTLIIYSAANDGTDIGPTMAPFEHFHEDRATKYCYSENGSGMDCPTPCGRCETVRHKRDGPFDTMNLAASGKNTIAVGAVGTSKLVLSFSSRGPARDGRVKPDLVADGQSLRSTSPSNGYTFGTGTSMSAPVVTGIAALIIEQWRRTMGGANPTPEMLRVLLIHGAEDLGNPGPDYTFGYGLVSAKNSVDNIIADGGSGSQIKTGSLTQGAAAEFDLSLAAGGSARLTLGWLDPEAVPFTDKTLINDLDLKVFAPNGGEIVPLVLNPADPAATATRGVNTRDNLEQIVFVSADGGNYRVQVSGRAMSSITQTFVLASSAPLGPAKLSCIDLYERNDTIDTAFGRLNTGTSLTSRICSASDVDFYRFIVDRSGPVSVTVTATDTPLRVTLLANASPVQTSEVAAGSSQTIQTSAGTGVDLPISPITYSVKIEPAGAIGPSAAYTLSVTFRRVPPKRQRLAGH